MRRAATFDSWLAGSQFAVPAIVPAPETVNENGQSASGAMRPWASTTSARIGAHCLAVGIEPIDFRLQPEPRHRRPGRLDYASRATTESLKAVAVSVPRLIGDGPFEITIKRHLLRAEELFPLSESSTRQQLENARTRTLFHPAMESGRFQSGKTYTGGSSFHAACQ